MRVSLLLMMMLQPLMADELPVSMAGEGRLHLIVPDGMPPLAEVEVTGGWLAEVNWEKDEAKRALLSDVHFAVDWWLWRTVTVRFIPRHDGEVALVLNGPWGEQKPGVPLRQEILWDEVRGSGADVANGAFDLRDENGPIGWNSPGQTYPKAGEWPSEAGLAASWQGRPLSQQLKVNAGREVTLVLTARAAAPPNFKEPKRLDGETKAHRYASRLKRGMNLGNGWEAPLEGWGIRFEAADVDRIADEGFDHIRVPVAWHHRMKDGVISPEFISEFEPVVKRALERKLRVIVNWHHFDDLIHDPEAHRERFVKHWEVIAKYFAGWPEELCLELYNEPRAPLEGELLNEIHADVIGAIRRIQPERTLMVNPAMWANVKKLSQLRLPDDEDNVIVSVHSYEPFEFTHQGASWVQLNELKGVTFPGPPAEPLRLPDELKERLGEWTEKYNTLKGEANPVSPQVIENALDIAAAWAERFGRPVHVGEFGAYQAGDRASRETYTRAVREGCEKRGIPWCLWEWKSGFGYWDSRENRPRLREALFQDSLSTGS